VAKLRALVPDLPRVAWIALGGSLLSALGSGFTLPYLLVYLHHVRGLDLELAGLALSTLAAAGFLGNPLGGSLSDRIGPRRALLFGLATAAGGAAWIAFVTEPWEALAAAALVGLGVAIVWPAESSLLATVVEPAQRSSVFSVHYAALNLGFGIGAAASAAIVNFDSPRSFQLLYALDASSFLLFAAVLLALRGVGTTRVRAEGEARGSLREVLADRVFLRVWLLMALIVTVGYAQFHAAFPAYATGPGGLSAGALGLAFTANTFGVVAFQLVALKLAEGRRRTRGIVLVCTFMAAAWVVTLVAGTVSAAVLFLLAMLLLALGETLVAPTLPPLVNDLAPDRLRGRYNGAFTLAWTSGFVAGPALAAPVLGAGQETALFLGFAAVLGLVAIGALDLERRLPAGANLVGGRPRDPVPSATLAVE
jgi:MFS family permease